MKRLIAFLFVAAAACAQTGDLATERQQVIDLMKQGQCQPALPLIEHLIAANQDDAAAQGWLAYCLFTQSRLANAPAEADALRKRARAAAERSRQLGSKWVGIDNVLAALNEPVRPYSANAQANARMKDGEAAFSKGDYPAALAAYAAALALDPKLYDAALFSGDVCFRTKDLACASEWFSKAIAINPARDAAYRYWGDAFMAAGKMMEARDKFIEAVIAEPSKNSWNSLLNWAKRNNCQLTAPKIELPKIEDNPQTIADDGTGRAAWATYGITRAAWRKELFAKTYPLEAQYRHSLAEETATLNAVADAVERQQTPHLDPQLANVLALKRDGLLEAWILLNDGNDPGVAQDYAAYRNAHHAELRAYFDKYIIHPAPPANPN